MLLTLHQAIQLVLVRRDLEFDLRQLLGLGLCFDISNKTSVNFVRYLSLLFQCKTSLRVEGHRKELVPSGSASACVSTNLFA